MSVRSAARIIAWIVAAIVALPTNDPLISPMIDITRRTTEFSPAFSAPHAPNFQPFRTPGVTSVLNKASSRGGRLSVRKRWRPIQLSSGTGGVQGFFVAGFVQKRERQRERARGGGGGDDSGSICAKIRKPPRNEYVSRLDRESGSQTGERVAKLGHVCDNEG